MSALRRSLAVARRAAAHGQAGWGRAALIAGAFAAVGLALVAAVQPVHPVGDMAQYRAIALNLVRGHGYAQTPGEPTAQRVPLYPLFQAAIYAALGPSAQPLRAAQVLIAAATLLLVYGLGATLGGRRAGAWAAAAAALYPATMFYAQALLSETLFTFFVIGAAWCAVSGRRPVGAGALIGLAALTRPIGLMLGPALAAAAWWPRRNWKHPTLLLAAMLLALSPWVMRNEIALGRPLVADLTGGKNLLIGCNPYAGAREQGRRLFAAAASPLAGITGEVALDRAARRAALTYLGAHPGRIALLAPFRLAAFWGLDREPLYLYREGYFGRRPWLRWPLAVAGLGLAPLLGLALVGAAGADPSTGSGSPLRSRTGASRAQPRGDPRAAPLWAAMAALWLPHALLFAEPRFHFPLTPLLAVFAGLALARREVRAVRRVYVWAAACALAAIWIGDIVTSFSRFAAI